MKKVTCFIAIILFAATFMLSGCEKAKINISAEHYNYGKRAVEIADQFLDYKISAREAYNQLEILMDRRDELPDFDINDPNRANNSFLETDTLLMWCNIPLYEGSSGSYGEVLKYRNRIATAIGERER